MTAPSREERERLRGLALGGVCWRPWPGDVLRLLDALDAAEREQSTATHVSIRPGTDAWSGGWIVEVDGRIALFDSESDARVFVRAVGGER
jgi:hypothetical protein